MYYRNVPISRIFLTENGEKVLVIVIYFPVREITKEEFSRISPTNPLLRALEKREVSSFIFTASYYVILLAVQIITTICLYICYKKSKKTYRWWRAPVRVHKGKKDKKDDKDLEAGQEEMEMMGQNCKK